MSTLLLISFIIFLSKIDDSSSIECDDRNTPFLKEGICCSSCSRDEIKEGKCEIKNKIIKNQWLNNIIGIGDNGYIYSTITTSENDYLYFLTSSFPESNVRKFYILDNEGIGAFNEGNPFIDIQIYDQETKGRFESEIFCIKLSTENTNKEYLMSISKGNQNVETYDFYENMNYFNNIEETFSGIIASFNTIWPILKLNSSNNQNIYLFGFQAHEFDEDTRKSYFYVKKVSFSSIDIKTKLPTFLKTDKKACADTNSISCYETINNFIVCFYDNSDYQYTMIVYDNELNQKQTALIYQSNSDSGYDILYFKCIHFFGETGVFNYFTNDENPIAIFKFKKYVEENNIIIDAYITLSEIKYDNIFFLDGPANACDLIKIEDKKFYFIGCSINRETYYIISIFNYNQENFIQRVYSINIRNLYEMYIFTIVKASIYKNFLALGSSLEALDKKCHSFLLIFSYPNTAEISFDLYDYISNNNDSKIYDLILELKGEYIMENNIFGYIYFGIKIFENCKDLENIYLSDLNGEKIENEFLLAEKEKIKIIIPKNNIYEPFNCKFKYAVVVTEPEYSKFNEYPIEITGDTENEKNYFKRNYYIGKSSYYNILLKEKLTDICENNCELCNFHNTSICLSLSLQNIKTIIYTDDIQNNVNTIYSEEEASILIQNNSITKYTDETASDYIQNYSKIINNDEEILEHIKNNDIKTILAGLLLTNLFANKNDTIIRDNNTIYQITTTGNQKNNTYNISTILLGECEKILRNVYGIEDNEELIILKIDSYISDALIPIINYEVYHPRNKSKLDLNTYCKNESIYLNIPVNIDEDNLFKYDPNSEFYTDACTSYTSEKGTDILLNDRQEEYNENNMSLCENNCNYIGYKKETKESKCECTVKTFISNSIKQNDTLYYNFTEKTLTSNIVSMKCYNTLFSKEGLLTNIGSYI